MLRLTTAGCVSVNSSPCRSMRYSSSDRWRGRDRDDRLPAAKSGDVSSVHTGPLAFSDSTVGSAAGGMARSAQGDRGVPGKVSDPLHQASSACRCGEASIPTAKGRNTTAGSDLSPAPIPAYLSADPCDGPREAAKRVEVRESTCPDKGDILQMVHRKCFLGVQPLMLDSLGPAPPKLCNR